jgi:hypothetical protein
MMRTPALIESVQTQRITPRSLLRRLRRSALRKLFKSRSGFGCGGAKLDIQLVYMNLCRVETAKQRVRAPRPFASAEASTDARLLHVLLAHQLRIQSSRDATQAGQIT